MQEIQNQTKVPWNLWDVLYIFMGTFAINLMIAGIAHFLHINPKKDIYFTVGAQVILSIVPVILIYILIKYFYKSSFTETLKLKLNRDNTHMYIMAGVLVSFIIMISSLVLTLILKQFTSIDIDNPYTQYSPEKLKIITILGVLIAPIFEEVVFRGFMQPVFCQTIGTIPGLIVVALIFAFLHGQYMNYTAAMIIIINLALILGYARLHFNSTIPSIIAHFLNNLYAAISIYSGAYG